MCIRAPSEAPLVNSPAAHGLQTPSGDAVNQRIGLAMIIIISEPLAQVLTADPSTSKMLNFSILVTGPTAFGYTRKDGDVLRDRIKRGV